MTINIEGVKRVNNLGFDEAKTQELIANLKRDGVVVRIEDLDKYIRTQGLIVKVHIGRKRNFVKVNPKLFGIDLKNTSKETVNFFKQHIKMGKLSFIPDIEDKDLQNIESAVRMEKTRSSIGYDDSFMTLPVYNEFVKFFEEKKKEYFNKRDDILSRWELLIDDFKRNLIAMLDEFNSVDKEELYRHILAKIPTKQEYADSFYMTITAKAFPVAENLDMFSDDIQAQIKEGLNQETVATLYEVIGNALNDAFQNVNKAILSAKKNGKVAPKTLGAVNDAIKRVGQKNIFHNDKIEEIRKEMANMVKVSHDVDTLLEITETILAKIYGYACELDIESHIKLTESAYSEVELKAIFDMIKNVSFEQSSSEQLSMDSIKKLA